LTVLGGRAVLALDKGYRAGGSTTEDVYGDARADIRRSSEFGQTARSRSKAASYRAIVLDLKEPLQWAEEGEKPLGSLCGSWKDFGVSISAEEIDEARQEMWGNFPRQDR
jgi:hypothetical protein